MGSSPTYLVHRTSSSTEVQGNNTGGYSRRALRVGGFLSMSELDLTGSYRSIVWADGQ